MCAYTYIKVKILLMENTIIDHLVSRGRKVGVSFGFEDIQNETINGYSVWKEKIKAFILKKDLNEKTS